MHLFTPKPMRRRAIAENDEKFIVCAKDEKWKKYFETLLVNFECKAEVLIPKTQSTNETTDYSQNLLQDSETWLIEWADDVFEKLQNSEKSILIVQSELLRESYSKAHGIFLAELIWRKKITPIIIATVDLTIKQNDFARRARLLGGKPVLPIISAKDEESLLHTPALVLWDIFSDKNSFQEAKILADRQIKKTFVREEIQRSITNAIVAEQSAAYRHTLGGLQASLRIMEGAYRSGWLNELDIKEFFDIVRDELIKEGDNNKLAILDLSANAISNFELLLNQKLINQDADLEILICDDNIKKSGWEPLVKNLVRNRFGLAVKGFESRKELEKHLADNYHKNRIATLLLDVHYEQNAKVVDSVKSDYLRKIFETYPLLDVILFSSELNDGKLVREAYDLKYDFFFKELDQPIRNPVEDSNYFIKMLEKSIVAFPIRALQSVFETGIVDDKKSASVDETRTFFNLWKHFNNSSAILGMSSLYEYQYRMTCDFFERQISASEKDIYAVLSRTVKNNRRNHHLYYEEAFPLWKMFGVFATQARNNLTHNANLVINGDSKLPAIGLALPIIIAISTLHRLRTKQLDLTGLKKLCESMKSLCEAIIASGQTQKKQISENFLRIKFAIESSDADEYERLFDEMCVYLSENEDLLGEDNQQNLNTALRSESDFFANFVNDDNPFKDFIKKVYQITALIAASCLLDHKNSTLN